MESRFGGSRLDCAERSVQEPMRGSETPGWKEASSPSNMRKRMETSKVNGTGFADSERRPLVSLYSQSMAQRLIGSGPGIAFGFFDSSAPENSSDNDFVWHDECHACSPFLGVRGRLRRRHWPPSLLLPFRTPSRDGNACRREPG